MQSEKELTTGDNAKQEALLKAQGVRVDFSSRDKMAMREAREEPSAQQYIDDLQNKLGTLHNTLKKLRQAVIERQHQTIDIDEKIEFQKLMSEAENSVLHALARPEEPWRVHQQQQYLENAKKNFQKDHIAPTERMLKTLTGEPMEETPSSQETYETSQTGKASKDEIGRLKMVAESRANLPPDELSELQSEVSSALERLQIMAPEIDKMMSEKAFSPEEKDEKLKRYETMYEEYEKTKTELLELLQRLKGK